VLKSQNSSINQAWNTKNYKGNFSRALLDDGLGYGNLPKGLLRLSQIKSENRNSYPDQAQNPRAMKHLIEGVQYAF